MNAGRSWCRATSISVETAETAQAAQDTALADVNLAKSEMLVAQAAIGDAKAQQQ